MKKLIFTLTILVVCIFQSFAQTPLGFKYQAVARNSQNQPYINQNLKIKFSIIEDDGTMTGTGPIIYSEAHDATTTDLGLFSLNVGSGSILIGDFENLDWGNAEYWLKVEMDPNGGNNFAYMGKSQLFSVPYAFHARTVENADDADANPTNEIQDLTFDENTNMLSISNSNSVDLSELSGGGGSNDDQVLSLSGTNLTIENGNTIDLEILQDGTMDADANPMNEIQILTFDSNTNQLSISGGNSVNIPTGGTDADADPTNEIQTINQSGLNVTLSKNGGSFNIADNDNDVSNELQTISKTGNTVSLSNNGGSFTDEINDADSNPNNELQNLSFDSNTNQISISNGNSITIPTGGTDADADPTNEIQTLTQNGLNVSLSNNGGNINVADNDNDSSNEIQVLTFDSNTNQLSISDGNSIAIPTGGSDADPDPTNELQTIFQNGQNITLSNNGGTFSIADDDNNAQNELQTLSKNGNQITLSNGGGTISDEVNDADFDPQNEVQNLNLNGTNLSISQSNAVDLSIIQDGVNDADADPTNEYQDLNLTGTNLNISNGNSVDLSIVQDGYEDADADPFNEVQDLSIDVNNFLHISGGNSVSLNNYTSPWSAVGNGISYTSGITFTDAIQTNVITSFGNDLLSQFDNTGIELKDNFANIESNYKVGYLEFLSGLNSSKLESNQLHFSGSETSTLNDFNLNFTNTGGQFSNLGALGLTAYDQIASKDLILNLTDGLSFYANNKSFKYDWNQLDFINDINGNAASLYPGSMIFYNDQNFNDPSSLINEIIVSFQDGISNGVLKAEELTFSNNGIANKLKLSAGTKGTIQLYNSNFNETALLNSSSSNTGTLHLKDNTGNVTIGLSHLSTDTDHGYLQVKAGDDEKAVLYAHTDNHGLMRLRGANESTNVLMSAYNNNSGTLGLYDNLDKELIRMRAYQGQAGSVNVYATNIGGNDRNATISWLSGYLGHGYMGVFDWQGDVQAGIYVDADGLGRVFADLKNFRMEHPEKEGKEIWYASLEGPEAGAYERGTSQLSNGEAFVEFSEHFQLVGNHETMTVTLTPLSADTYGLAVIEKRANGFVVKELAKGTGSFEFDWEVKCVRKGYEDYRVIRDEIESRPGDLDR